MILFTPSNATHTNRRSDSTMRSLTYAYNILMLSETTNESSTVCKARYPLGQYNTTNCARMCAIVRDHVLSTYM